MLCRVKFALYLQRKIPCLKFTDSQIYVYLYTIPETLLTYQTIICAKNLSGWKALPIIWSPEDQVKIRSES